MSEFGLGDLWIGGFVAPLSHRSPILRFIYRRGDEKSVSLLARNF